MNELPIITSRRNPRIVAARKLGQRKHRLRQGRFLVEGLALLQMALDAEARPLEVFYCPKVIRLAAEGRDAGKKDKGQGGGERGKGTGATVLERLLAAGAEPVAVSLEVLAALAERQVPEGIVATFPLLDISLDDLHPTGHDLVLVLDRLQDPGNLGTLIRTADAVGAAAVLLIEPCVDPFDPKTVRGTMGSLFNVPLVRTADVSELFAWLSRHGLRAVGANAHRGQPWGEGLWQESVALVLGNEARGLSKDVSQHVEAWARLPIAGRAESLNVAVAGGVLMYTWLQQKLRRERKP